MRLLIKMELFFLKKHPKLKRDFCLVNFSICMSLPKNIVSQNSKNDILLAYISFTSFYSKSQIVGNSKQNWRNLTFNFVPCTIC